MPVDSLTQLGEPFARGRTAELFAWDPGRALKLFYAWVPREDAERETRVGRIVSAAGVPAPRVDELVALDGRFGIVFERIEGRSMLALITTQPWRITAVARQMARLHAAVHAVRAPDLPAQHARLRARIEHAAPLTEPLRAAALAALDRLPPGNVLCHGDFHPDNVLLTANGPVIIDWLDATAGHPLADVARTMLLLTLGEPVEGISPVVRWMIEHLRGTLARAYLRTVLALHGAAQADLDAWALPVAAARLDDNIPAETERVLARVEALARLMA